MNAEMINYDASAVEFLKEKYEIDQKPAEKKIKVENPTSDIEEVDLHIEEIIDNFANLSNGEIVNIQLARFTTALEGAILSKTKRIVFIHGVGNGKLKYELCKTLDTKYPDLKYQDASYAEYGFGATMVFLK
jgi:dsDNA-specific endonuclease/ATPase MutS2